MNRLFIIGSPRSGTTLLRLMLNRHSDITVPPEAGFLTWLYQDYKSFTFSESVILDFVNDLLLTKKIANWGLSETNLKGFLLKTKPNTYSELIDAVYRYYSQNICGKSVKYLGDKNNFFINDIELISSLYPNSMFIQIVRDGRSVAKSYKDLAEKKIDSINAPNLPSNIPDIARTWMKDINVSKYELSKLNKSRVLTVRFEDLVIQPQSTLEVICTFLNISFDHKMLTYYETTEGEGLEPKEFLAWKEKNKKPILDNEAFKYKMLSEDEFLEFTKIASKELSLYGYLSNEY
ncbi:sulfotransferase family protein [Pseudoalteromonas atlantica]|uniref:sulfotransferase family protein n=1 Tax=Pseudoalteromonas atlantica TaxID=288 RepID=UPI0012FDCAE7|nr:sulfotransferase [Pseudoalteromonas atlantica]